MEIDLVSEYMKEISTSRRYAEANMPTMYVEALKTDLELRMLSFYS